MHEYTKYKIKCRLKEAGKFVLDNKVAFLQMGIMAAVVIAPDIGFCSTTGAADNTGIQEGKSGITITALKDPVEKIGATLTGPVPAIFTVISGAIGGLSWGMGWEQQITQRALKCVGGGAVAMSAGGIMDNLGITAGCIIG